MRQSVRELDAYPAEALDRHPEYADVDAIGIHLLNGEVAGC